MVIILPLKNFIRSYVKQSIEELAMKINPGLAPRQTYQRSIARPVTVSSHRMNILQAKSNPVQIAELLQISPVS